MEGMRKALQRKLFLSCCCGVSRALPAGYEEQGALACRTSMCLRQKSLEENGVFREMQTQKLTELGRGK